MRRLADAKQSWQELQQYPSLAELKEAVRLDGHLSVPNNGLRSACWKAFLLFDNVDTASWPRILLSSRSAYNSLRLHFLRHIENPDEQPDPLNEDIDVRPSPTLSFCLRDGRGLTDS
jgi:TBC1 domain family protein 5